MPDMRQGVQGPVQPRAAHARTHGGETVHVHGVREAVQPEGEHEGAHDHAHGYNLVDFVKTHYALYVFASKDCNFENSFGLI